MVPQPGAMGKHRRSGSRVMHLSQVGGCAWPSTSAHAAIVPPMTEAIETRDRPEKSRYELLLDGRLAGVATYELADDAITVVHTQVAKSFGGLGLGSRLARDVLDDIRARGLRVRVECPFMAAYVRSHPDYQDVVIP